ncbi:sugar phosphate nucleotidyltransferase [Rheinheimera sp.]|uniref:sugar phosphate nucleotidyltransferase n=1 Tax=Rheinheimera sp. TaxID=1869214 RepID=UPI0027370022|nr:sugar phosphate nucleotidyltransferase [Rheinheimera sp.]MDP2715474.1 sugar phosphate nucleotidyltransferase [Rheinheimera sp.]
MSFSKAGKSFEHIYAPEDITADRQLAPANSSGKYWAIVLAGGRGERMREAIQEWLGTYRPKQFCRFAGDRSMLEHTWDRARQIVGQKNIVTVSVAEQAVYFDEMDINSIPGTVLYQPDSNGTAAAIYLALAHILAIEPEANVIIMPSDHFIFPESHFVTLAATALSAAAVDTKHLILLGAEARWPNPDFGWIESGTRGAVMSEADLQPVSAFVEKPDNQQARRLFSNNALWSTMIIAANGQLLWQLAETLQPKFFLCFLYLHRLTRGALQGDMLREAVDKAIHNTFQYMPGLDFSSDLLQKVAQQCLVLPMTAIDWDDWGRPERILECIERYGLDSSLSEARRSIC